MTDSIPSTMKGCVLLGDSKAEIRDFTASTASPPRPGHAIMRDTLAVYAATNPPDKWMHRPCSCTAPFDPDAMTGRMAYGWQRDGGMAEYLLCRASSLVKMPDAMSYLDGAMLACGYGTAYSGVMKAAVSGHHRVLIVGLGPVGLSAAQICNALGAKVYGYDIDPARSAQALKHGVQSLAKEEVEKVEHGCVPLTRGYDVVIECSGVAPARVMAVLAAKRWGTCVFLGGYNDVTLQVSPWVIQKQLTIRGSWTCSVTELETLCRKLAEWDVHPDELVSHTMSLDKCPEAFDLFSKGQCSKVAIVFE
ncbi:hypothetical protein IAR55_004218 [Kwoniella newhampshirensis]|uniref:Alcohol dehydrogenase-like C-terminal domain-containing protein n=1 Tax=Kwoniella newhampshirensis TaxID=1651941 RepID=A0AAW0YZ49_9TREE